ncbi:MAG: secondary thiamine-phosphate synthase enzyme YjbQ [Eubacteriales bacterium]|nr:secondary thiamine-phosphate synthase enzyme YjbQ [Eubacteriales bacterium]
MEAKKFTIHTPREDFINITRSVRETVEQSGAQSGIVVVWCAHTTAGITVNENADPDVVTDMLYGLEQAYPDRREFRHMEGNSAAHLKSSAMGVSKTIPFEQGKLLLGIWQGIYFCEFDGPRTRQYYVKVIEG